MFCKHCGSKIEESVIFCPFCGKSVSEASDTSVETETLVKTIERPSGDIIKCRNCKYEGPGELSRTTVAQIFAWLGIVISSLITIIYYAVTFRNMCPECKSTTLDVKNHKGIFVYQKRSGRPIMVLIWVLVGMAVLALVAVFATVILTSLAGSK